MYQCSGMHIRKFLVYSLAMEQRIHRIFVIFGLATVVNNITLILLRGEIQMGQILLYALVPLIITGFVIVMSRLPARWLRISHVLVLLIIASISIMEAESHYMGLIFWIITYYLMSKYGFFVRRTVLKLVIAASTLLIAFSISFFVFGLSDNIASIPILFFFFFGIFYYGDRETFLRYREREKALKAKIEDLESLPGVGDYVDLLQLGFTARELEVGQILSSSMGTNKELAYDLGISTNTIGKHLSSMMEKAQVPSRQHLIDMIRPYYLQLQREDRQPKALVDG
jgi:DNA-binding CsgD family transcriptional regulator